MEFVAGRNRKYPTEQVGIVQIPKLVPQNVSLAYRLKVSSLRLLLLTCSTLDASYISFHRRIPIRFVLSSIFGTLNSLLYPQHKIMGDLNASQDRGGSEKTPLPLIN